MENDVFSSLQFNLRDEASISTSTKQDPIMSHIDHESGFMDIFSLVQSELFQNVSDDFWKAINMPMEVDQPPNLEVAPTIIPEFTKHGLKEKSQSSSVSLASSWELLNRSFKGFRMPREDKSLYNPMSNETNSGEQKLSVEEILRLAGEEFIQFSTNRVDGISMFIHPYGSSLSGLSMDDARDVELVHLLLATAENIGSQCFDQASKQISRCLWKASDSGSPIQRVSFYFAEALQDKIKRDSERIAINCKKNHQQEKQQEHKGLALGTNNTFLATHQELPFAQVMQFAAVQSIIDNLKTSRKIHLIDLQIRSGIQWTALMQGLSESAIQHLKITAIGTADQLHIEETGKRLMSFAKSLNLPFSFKVVYLEDMSAFKEYLLNIEDDETVAVYSYLMLRSMISRPDLLENLMRAITRMKPSLMVVIEVEANHNSPSFIDRFIEALLFYSAFFDCLEDCMERSSQHRAVLEGDYSGEGIRNIVAADGHERITRSVKLNVWRAFFTRFGMMEIELSESSRYQAGLVLKEFAKGSSCSLECNGKGLVVGWKGTPFHSLTAWKFA